MPYGTVAEKAVKREDTCRGEQVRLFMMFTEDLGFQANIGNDQSTTQRTVELEAR